MKLQILKTLGFFILLLAATPSFAVNSPAEDLKERISFDISEDIHQSSGSTFISSNSFDTHRNLSQGTENFYFQSSYVAKIAVRYVVFSRSIEPGLNTFKIIYPFHTFL